ncbi:regulator of chromosome condensation 1/beta-lactamase-inhibitor protein II, partial [Schizophyllum fasciatum]
MTQLHAHFYHRNKQAFQRLLDADRAKPGGGAPSTSAGRGTPGSWTRTLTAMGMDVNKRDWLGRTVLHLACSARLEALDYVRMLLRHPAINVNLADAESGWTALHRALGWTALHRALYAGNLPAAILLLQRSDIDSTIKDLEGYTAFDLFNATVEGTKPVPNDSRAELFTWGINKNAALGVGDGDDRVYPESVSLTALRGVPLDDQRFLPAHTHAIEMAKLHTAVITTEPLFNIHLCGFGSGGSITSAALGQDHTLVLTSAGEVLSWGLNRFSQLGYVVEVTGPFTQEPIQATPRRIMGALRKETVQGVAAAKTCSACWTAEEVYTWGTNAGQLGYDQPVQVLPRKVTWVSRVVDIALSDTAMACLLQSRDVVLLCNYQHTKLSFPTAFPSEIQPYRPPQAIKNAHISKISTGDGVFGALSSNGEVFTFRPPPAVGDGKEKMGAVLRSDPKEKLRSDIKERGGRGANVVPLRVWALRKQFTAIRVREEERYPGWRPTSSRARGAVYDVDGLKAALAREDEHEDDEDERGIVHDLYVLRDICGALI